MKIDCSPAKAGAQAGESRTFLLIESASASRRSWIPACAGERVKHD